MSEDIFSGNNLYRILLNNIKLL